MGDLTEVEIFDCLADNFKSAAADCEHLARSPVTGPTYKSLRDKLRLIEGAAKQASAWREDTRWLGVALKVAEAHKKAGTWLRGAKLPNGVKIKLADRDRFQLFTTLANVLRAGHKSADALRTRATGIAGMILPKPLPGPHRDTRPVGFSNTAGPGFTRLASGLVVPSGIGTQ